MEDKTGGEIVSLCFQRDERALEMAQKQYGALLHGVCFRILGDRRDAEECVSDALFKMWMSIPPQKPDSLRAYLCAIARNAALHVYEKKKCAGRVPDGLTDAFEELSELLPGREAVEDAVTEKELSRLIDRFLSTLGKRARLIFLYRFYFCFSTAETAERMKIGQRAVQVSLKQTKEKLKSFLKTEGYEV